MEYFAQALEDENIQLEYSIACNHIALPILRVCAPVVLTILTLDSTI